MRPQLHRFDANTIRYHKILKKITQFIRNHIFLIVAAIGVWCYCYYPMVHWSGYYADADGYMRALRVYHWLLNPTFFEQPIYESNYPFGEVLHWTRPMDIIWLIVSLPFWLLSLSVKETIFLSGIYIAPILGVLSVMALAYGLRRQFSIYLVLFGVLIFVFDKIALGYLSPARPDHHALMIYLSMYAYALVLCWLKKRQNRYLRWMGVALGIAVVTAIEGIFIYGLFLCFFLWLYVAKNISLVSTVKIAKYFALTLSVFWFLNPPYEGWMYPDNGRLSILYVAVAWMVFCGLWILNVSHLHMAKLKVLSLLCMASGFLLTLIVVFGPEIIKPPLDDEIRQVWSTRISEMRNVTTISFSGIVLRYGFIFVALVINLFMLKVKPYYRVMVFNLILGVPLFVVSLWAARFNNYQHLYMIVPYVVLVDYLYKKSRYARNKNFEFPGYIYLVCLSILLFNIGRELPRSLEILEENDEKKVSSYSSLLCSEVKNIGGTLVTEVFKGPIYMWQCGVNVVGTPYHRNRRGLIDNHQILFATNDMNLLTLLLNHQVRQILVFDGYDDGYYKPDEENKNKLYWRLINRQNVPSYLSEVPSGHYGARLYELKI